MAKIVEMERRLVEDRNKVRSVSEKKINWRRVLVQRMWCCWKK